MSKEEKIKWKKCNKCGFLQHIDHLRCLNCKNDNFEVIEGSDQCKLLSYTILKAPPMEFQEKKSYALGIVEFNNGIKALGQLSTTADLNTGMNLVPEYTRICNNFNGKEIYAYVFKSIK